MGRKKSVSRKTLAASTKGSGKSKKQTAARQRVAAGALPRSFTAVIRGRDKVIQSVAKALRRLVLDELPDAKESFYGGRNPMGMYRTAGEVCWIQPFTRHCNLYFLRGPELSDPHGQLQGSSDRSRYVRIRTVDEIDEFPLRDWIREVVELNDETIANGISFDDALARLRSIALSWPATEETETWGKPHFRVQNKIFCGCGEANGRVRIGMKAEPHESELLMKLPGIEKAPYSRPHDGWISIDQAVFDDWGEIERLVRDSYRLIAPKRLLKEIGD